MTLRPASLGCAVAVVLAVTGPAQAGLVPTVVTVTPDNGTFRWAYSLVLPGYMRLQSGDYFSIYDFNGFVPGNTGAPAGWTFSGPAVGPQPPHVAVTDDPGVANL
ncbi:MAG: hypothetical protein ACKODX_22570, partial [Gemmata sp.]